MKESLLDMISVRGKEKMNVIRKWLVEFTEEDRTEMLSIIKRVRELKTDEGAFVGFPFLTELEGLLQK